MPAAVRKRLPPMRYDMQARRMTRCQADDDGNCKWKGCPQLKDNEPEKTGRHCPFDKAPHVAESE